MNNKLKTIQEKYTSQKALSDAIIKFVDKVELAKVKKEN